MKVLKFVGNLIGVLLSIVVSVALLVSLIAAPVLSGVTKLVQSNTLLSVIQSIDLSPFDSEDPTTPATPIVPELPIVSEHAWAADLLETELAEKLVNMYMDDFLSVSMGGPTSLTVESMKTLVMEHMHEVLPIVRRAVTESGEEMIDQEIEDAILSFIDESGQELIDSLPTHEDLNIGEDVTLALSFLRSNILRTGVTILVIVFSILILIFRFPRFKGFMWLAVVYILGTLFSMGTGAGMSALLPGLILTEEPILAGALTPVLAVLAKTCYIGGAIMLVLAVAFILIFAIGRNALKKKKLTTASSDPAVEKVAPVSIPSYVTEGYSAASSNLEPAVDAVEPAVQPIEPVVEEPIEEPVEEI